MIILLYFLLVDEIVNYKKLIHNSKTLNWNSSLESRNIDIKIFNLCNYFLLKKKQIQSQMNVTMKLYININFS